MNVREKAEELAKRPYWVVTSVDTTTDGNPVYLARVLEIEGCFGQGESREAALEDLNLAMVDFIQSLLEDKLPIPEPTRLFSPTFGTATQGAFTFIGTKQSKNLQPKENEVYQDEYFLSAHVG